VRQSSGDRTVRGKKGRIARRRREQDLRLWQQQAIRLTLSLLGSQP